MLTSPLIDQLRDLRCPGMVEALQEQLLQTDHALCFEERLSLLVEREWWLRENRRIKTRLQKAALKNNACLEDLDYDPNRRLSKAAMQTLSRCHWIRAKQNILIIGSTGCGKTFLACALAHKACLEGFSARYLRLPRLFQELNIARGDGRYSKLMQQLAKIDVLILDDWGLSGMNDSQRRELLEVIEDRHTCSSTVITSQLPQEHWHEWIGDPTLADAILDRLVHNAHKIKLEGPSMRKKYKCLDENIDLKKEEDNN
jgi:DNA replication protein DnaC